MSTILQDREQPEFAGREEKKRAEESLSASLLKVIEQILHTYTNETFNPNDLIFLEKIKVFESLIQNKQTPLSNLFKEGNILFFFVPFPFNKAAQYLLDMLFTLRKLEVMSYINNSKTVRNTDSPLNTALLKQNLPYFVYLFQKGSQLSHLEKVYLTRLSDKDITQLLPVILPSTYATFSDSNTINSDHILHSFVKKNLIKSTKYIVSVWGSEALLKVDNHGETVLHAAVQMESSDDDTVQMLNFIFSYYPKWDFNKRTNLEETILELTMNIRDSKGDYIQKLRTIEMLLALGSDPNSITHNGRTLLEISLYLQDVELVSLLLKYFANPNAVNSLGFTSLDYIKLACLNNSFCLGCNQLDVKIMDEIARFLKEAGATEVEIPDFLLPADLDQTIVDLTFEEKLKKEEAVSLNDEENKQLREAENKIEAIFKKERYKVFRCKSQQEIENIKAEHPNHLFFEGDSELEPKDPNDILLIVYEKLSREDQKMLQDLRKKTEPLVLRNQLGFDLLHYKMHPKRLDEYLKRFPYTQVAIGKESIHFRDLTNADDYVFFTNNIKEDPLSLPNLLLALQQGEPEFLLKTPCFSASVLDKWTRCYSGLQHQEPLLFPIYYGLDVPVEFINYLSPTDIYSPMGSETVNKIKYIHNNDSVITRMNIRQCMYQTKCLEQDPNSYIPPSPVSVRQHLIREKSFKISRCPMRGTEPLYTLDRLQHDTSEDPKNKNAYSEAILLSNSFQQGKDKIKAPVLIVQKYFLDLCLDKKKYDQLKSVEKEAADKVLCILRDIHKITNNRVELVLVDTDITGYRDKIPLLNRIQKLEKEMSELRSSLIKNAICLARHHKNKSDAPKSLSELYNLELLTFNKLKVELEYCIQLAAKPPRVMKFRKSTKEDMQAKISSQDVLQPETPKATVTFAYSRLSPPPSFQSLKREFTISEAQTLYRLRYWPLNRW